MHCSILSGNSKEQNQLTYIFESSKTNTKNENIRGAFNKFPDIFFGTVI